MPLFKKATPPALDRAAGREAFRATVNEAVATAREHFVHLADLAADLERLAEQLRFQLACLPSRA